jgi:hypothetical protein
MSKPSVAAPVAARKLRITRAGGPRIGEHGLSERHLEILLAAADAAQRAEQVVELAKILSACEGSSLLEGQLDFTSALTLLLEQVPKLRESTKTVVYLIGAETDHPNPEGATK